MLRFCRSNLVPWGCLAFLPAAVIACSCLESTVEQSSARSGLVFVASVIEEDPPEPYYSYVRGESVLTESSADMVRWLMVPSRGWKGVPGETLAVYSPASGASCGYRFEVGSQYLVYAQIAKRSGGGWASNFGWPKDAVFPAATTFLCDRTRPMESAGEDLAALGDPVWSREHVSDPPKK